MLLPLRGVLLSFFDTHSSYSMLYNIRRMNLIPYLYHSFCLFSLIPPRSKPIQIQTNVNLVHKSVGSAFIYQKAQRMKDKEFEHIAPVLRQRSVDTARSLGLDADDAEDVAQDALLRLWSLRGELHVGRVEALVVTVARNLSIDIHRRRRTVPMDSRPIIDELHTQPDTLMEVADDERWLEQRMQALPSTEFQVLHLRQVERKTDQQIAAILGIGIASVPTLLSRARRKLMQAMLARQRKE